VVIEGERGKRDKRRGRGRRRWVVVQDPGHLCRDVCKQSIIDGSQKCK